MKSKIEKLAEELSGIETPKEAKQVHDDFISSVNGEEPLAAGAVVNDGSPKNPILSAQKEE